MSLPQHQPLPLMQTTWASAIDPVLNNSLNQASRLQNVSLASGTNIISHKLGRKLEGWYTTRIRSSATIYDQQDTNQTPQLTLVLVASAPVTIDLAVF